MRLATTIAGSQIITNTTIKRPKVGYRRPCTSLRAMKEEKEEFGAFDGVTLEEEEGALTDEEDEEEEDEEEEEEEEEDGGAALGTRRPPNLHMTIAATIPIKTTCSRNERRRMRSRRATW